jgi:nitrilase
MRHIAVEGRGFVLSSCQVARRSDYPPDYPLDQDVDPTSLLIRGGSCIVDPFGDVLAGPVYGRAAILRAELDPSRIVRGKYDLDVAGHHARPDVFDLRVDETPRPAVRFETSRG